MSGLYDYSAFALDVRFVRALSSEVAHYFLNEIFECTNSPILNVSLMPESDTYYKGETRHEIKI